MKDNALTIGSVVALPKAELDGLLADLRQEGFQTVGPRVKDDSVIYTEIEVCKTCHAEW